MPFGKNKKLSAPRPKKSKVQARDDESDDAFGDDINKDHNEGIENVDPAKPAPASDTTPVPSPHSLKVQAAEDELLELQAEWEVRQEISEQEDAQLAMAQRLHDAKMRRLDARQRKRIEARWQPVCGARAHLQGGIGAGEGAASQRRGGGVRTQRRGEYAGPAVPSAAPTEREIVPSAAQAWCACLSEYSNGRYSGVLWT